MSNFTDYSIIKEIENDCSVSTCLQLCDLIETQKIEEAWLELYIIFFFYYPDFVLLMVNLPKKLLVTAKHIIFT